MPELVLMELHWMGVGDEPKSLVFLPAPALG
jgi:hypothetical protein